MKVLLAILLSFIMTEAPVLAIQGGYSLASSTPPLGLYAGVLIPVQDNLLVNPATDFGLNSLGLFTLSMPLTGLGTGTALIFSNGDTYTGTIQALPDPDPKNVGGIIGILNATFNYNLTQFFTDAAGNVTSTTTATTASAQGSFDVTLVQSSQSAGFYGVNLTGSSVVNVTQGLVSGSTGAPIITEQITFQVEGFQQSNNPAAATTTAAGG
jgi:hypothetical protein